MAMRKKACTERAVEHRDRLPAAAVRSPAREGFKRRVAVALREVVQWWTWQRWVYGWTRWS